ncbi:MAG: sulfur carrier protein ThiS [Phycisphaeraceae bacterium]|nr:sulfur carrier protein ThiS [Phycisphaeraceae bacterium]
MSIQINGSSTTIPIDHSVEQLVETLGLKGKACAVEVNRALVPKRDHARTKLKDGDMVELVTLVGGG